MIRKGNGRQPDNTCFLILIIFSKKACNCCCHLILIDLSKNKTVTVSIIEFVITTSKKTQIVCEGCGADGMLLLKPLSNGCGAWASPFVACPVFASLTSNQIVQELQPETLCARQRSPPCDFPQVELDCLADQGQNYRRVTVRKYKRVLLRMRRLGRHPETLGFAQIRGAV